MRSKICLLGIVIIVMLLFGSVATASQTDHAILIGYDGQHWFSGMQIAQKQRTRIGFFGYQEDHITAQITSSVPFSQLLGHVEIGRNVFVGNVKYQINFLGGNTRYSAEDITRSSVRVFGELMQLQGAKGYGLVSRIHLIGTNHFDVMAFMELRCAGTWRIGAGVGSDPFYGSLTYSTSAAAVIESSVTVKYDLDQEFRYTIDLVYDEDPQFTLGFQVQHQAMRAILAYKF